MHLNPSSPYPVPIASRARVLLVAGLASWFCVASCWADLGDLAVTTSWLANSNSRGNTWNDRSQQFTMDFYGDIAVSREGFVLCVSTYEEAYSGCITYRNGDLCPDDAPWMMSSAVTVTDDYAYYAFSRKGGGPQIMKVKRKPGFATDGNDCQGAQTVKVTTDPADGDITGLAVDETHDRLYAALPTAGKVLVFKASDLSPVAGAGWDLPRATRLTVDGLGNVWVSQAAENPHLEKLAGTTFGSAAADDAHGPDMGFGADRSTTYEAANAGGFIGMDLGSPQSVAAVRYLAAGGDWKGGKWQAANDPKGPWSDLVSIDHSPSASIEEWLNLDPGHHVRFVRFSAPDGEKISASELGIYTLAPYAPGKVVKFDPSGHQLLTLPGIERPGPIHFDAPRRRLIVADMGTQQLAGFTGVDTQPVVDASFGVGGRFGEAGGVLAGPAAGMGRVGPLRFDEIRGFGIDGQGNITVANAGSIGVNQTRLETYAPDGKPLWDLKGLAFLDMACPDPANESDVYDNGNLMHLDYSRLAGDEWSQVAETTNPIKYPDDPRLNLFGAQIYGMRRIHGQLFLITTTQAGVPLSFARFSPATDGYCAIPCALLTSRRYPRKPFPAYEPAGMGTTLWVDKNGDGDFQPGEFQKLDNITALNPFVDDDGDIWFAERFDIRRLAVSKTLDAHGVPAWSFDSPGNVTFPRPAPFTGNTDSVTTAKYDTASGALFCFGFNAARPKTLGINHPVGTILARYIIVDGKLNLTNQVDLPYDVDFGGGVHDQVQTSALAGDYIFVGYYKRMTVRVYRKRDLSLVGTINSGKQACAPIYDGPPELIAYKRPNVNEYLLFDPEYTANGTTMLRWLPDVTAAPVAPDKFAAAATGNQVTLTWTAAPAAEGYHVERRDFTVAGWGPWAEIAKVNGATYEDRGLTGGARYSYRVRAFNTVPAGGNSDYTQTVYVSVGPAAG